jgi:hypothetical protein
LPLNDSVVATHSMRADMIPCPHLPTVKFFDTKPRESLK